MDSLVTAAARSLAMGDPLAALKRIALRGDAPALALRGIAMAQLGEYSRARLLLRRAARAFGPREQVARARCQVAEAEVALAERDLTWSHGLDAAARVLAAHGDPANALHARLLAARYQLVVGDIAAAEATLARLDGGAGAVSAFLVARVELARAEVALRRLRIGAAAAAVQRASAAAAAARIPALLGEVERLGRAFSAPAARLIRGGDVRTLRLGEVEALSGSGDLIVDGCRRLVRGRSRQVDFARSSVRFELVRALAEAWPGDVAREQLITRTFAARVPNESHRARLRVEMGRLRTALRGLARIEATTRGFALSPSAAPGVVVLAPPIDGPAGAVLALLEDGESWSTSALAYALGSSQRTVQRTLRELEDTAAVRSVGHGRSRRWLAPTLTGFATTLLLPGSLPMG